MTDTNKHREKVETFIAEQVEKRVQALLNQPAKQFSLQPSGIQVNGLSGQYKGLNMAQQAKGLHFRTDSEKEKFIKGMIDVIRKTNNETSDSAGGYLVPTNITQEILRFAAQNSVFLADARIIEMTSDKHTVPTEVSGITVTGENEEAALNSSHPVFGEVSLDARRYGAVATVSNELMADSAVDLITYFTTIMSEAIGSKIDELGFSGSDTWTGALSGASYTQTIGTSAYSGITAGDLADAMGLLTASKLNGAKFYFGGKTISALRKETDDNGSYIFPPAEANSIYYGLPLVNCEQLPNPEATSTDFGILTSLRQSYVLGVRTNSLTLEIDPYGLFDTFRSRLRLVWRGQGKVGLGSGIVRFRTSA